MWHALAALRPTSRHTLDAAGYRKPLNLHRRSSRLVGQAQRRDSVRIVHG
jgi:hypothetical protein